MKSIVSRPWSIAILAVLVSAASCITPPEFEGAKPVLAILGKAVGPGQPMSFGSGPHRGGRAVIGPTGEAFWTKDGKAYYVDDAAKNIAPGIEKAPESIQFDDVFKQAAEYE